MKKEDQDMTVKEEKEIYMEQPSDIDDDILLRVENIKKYFPIKSGILKRTVGHLKAVDDISFHIYKGETLGIVGESGSGKSTLGRVLLRLLDPTEGQIIFNSVDITTMNNRGIRPFRKEDRKSVV